MDSLANKPIQMILFLIKFSGRIQIHEYAYHYFHLREMETWKKWYNATIKSELILPLRLHTDSKSRGNGLLTYKI